jgi:hypothetical protein
MTCAVRFFNVASQGAVATVNGQYVTDHAVNGRSPSVNRAHIPITNSTLKTAEPTMVANPTFDWDTNVLTKLVASSGADPPAACHRVSGQSARFRVDQRGFGSVGEVSGQSARFRVNQQGEIGSNQW